MKESCVSICRMCRLQDRVRILRSNHTQIVYMAESLLQSFGFFEAFHLYNPFYIPPRSHHQQQQHIQIRTSQTPLQKTMSSTQPSPIPSFSWKPGAINPELFQPTPHDHEYTSPKERWSNSPIRKFSPPENTKLRSNHLSAPPRQRPNPHPHPHPPPIQFVAAETFDAGVGEFEAPRDSPCDGGDGEEGRRAEVRVPIPIPSAPLPPLHPGLAVGARRDGTFSQAAEGLGQ